MHPHLSCAQCVTSYVAMQLQYIAAFGGLQAKLQQTKVVVSSLNELQEFVQNNCPEIGFWQFTCTVYVRITTPWLC